MSDSVAARDPRWGAEGRDRKALAILRTLTSLQGPGVLRGTWLDIGCGSGLIAAHLSESVDRVVGVDPESWARWPELSGSRSNLEFHVGSYRELPRMVSLQSVDVVVCNQVYEHVDSPLELLSSIHEVLRRGGVCYFAGPNLLWPIEPHVHLPFVHWIPSQLAVSFLKWMGNDRHRYLDARSLDFWRLRRLFKRTGFVARSAFVARARAGIDLGEAGKTLRLAASMPPIVEAVVQPLLPGFVHVLHKR